jgi:hypothetical protein
MDDDRARHIGDIIREHRSRAAMPTPKPEALSQASRVPRLVLRTMLDMLAMIGWLVSLPFIGRVDRALTSRAHPRG